MSVAMLKTDGEIQQDVLRELKWDPRVDPTEVGVQVTRGVVMLSGTIDSYAKKVAAKEAAHRVMGVLDVVNDLVVALPSKFDFKDQDVAHAVRHALEWDVLVPNDRIHSTVSHGWVTLEGEVDTWAQRQDAERAVERLAGVQGLNNRVLVRPNVRLETQKIRDSIEEALDRQARREAKRIGIKIEDGVVTVTGTVRSWAERNAVLNVVNFAPGVKRVEDQLITDSYR